MTEDKKKKNLLLNASEAFGLWEMLNAKYKILERFNVWTNYVHDKDFELLLFTVLGQFNDFKEMLEKALADYGIKSPDSHTLTTRTTINSDIIRDHLIANDMFWSVQEHFEMVLASLSSATTNDNVRKMYIYFIRKDLDLFGTVIKYLKIKGWLYIPPMYTQTPSTKIKVDAGEAFNLWSHLTYRYDNLDLTETCINLVNDGDFKAVLRSGKKLLEKQAKTIEKELQHFGIVIPIKPPVVSPPAPTHVLDDDHIFRYVFSGISGAVIIHGKAVKQSTTNDRIRNLFSRLVSEEVGVLDNMIKFGKMKGWLHPAPSFKEF